MRTSGWWSSSSARAATLLTMPAASLKPSVRFFMTMALPSSARSQPETKGSSPATSAGVMVGVPAGRSKLCLLKSSSSVVILHLLTEDDLVAIDVLDLELAHAVVRVIRLDQDADAGQLELLVDVVHVADDDVKVCAAAWAGLLDAV